MENFWIIFIIINIALHIQAMPTHFKGNIWSYYYPYNPDPRAIVFPGPTNYNPKYPVYESRNDIDDEYFDIDVRFNRPDEDDRSNEKQDDVRFNRPDEDDRSDEKQDNCPPGYIKQGDVCFPND